MAQRPLVTQATAYGRVFSTPEEVRALWEEVAAESPWELEEQPATEKIAAYVSDGRWVADCPRCYAGMFAWPENDRAACLGCGAVWRVKFPSARQREEAEELLDALERPAQNWFPNQGERVATLRERVAG